jgi:hypothetical protein
MKWIRRLAFIVPSLLVVALTALVLGASSWLETEAGRNLLQGELSKSLSLNAELRGDYSLKLFPGIRIAGEQLQISPLNATQPLAEIEAYDLHLALLPLLRKEILIHEVAVHNGLLDVDLLTLQAETGGEGSATQLPKIESLVVTGLSLIRSNQELIQVAKLEIRNFAENRKFPVNLELSLPPVSANPASFSLDGLMQIAANPFEVNVVVDGLLLTFEGQSWPLGAGQLDWFGESGEFAARLRGELYGFASDVGLTVQTSDALFVQAQVELRSSDSPTHSGKVQARDQSNYWSLDQVELNLDGQELIGSGCFHTGDEMLLQLLMRAGQLDLDSLQDMLPADLLTGSAETGSVSADLPFQLALVLQAEQARMSGAIAKDVRLQLGNKPDCPANKDQLSD